MSGCQENSFLFRHVSSNVWGSIDLQHPDVSVLESSSDTFHGNNFWEFSSDGVHESKDFIIQESMSTLSWCDEEIVKKFVICFQSSWLALQNLSQRLLSYSKLRVKILWMMNLIKDGGLACFLHTVVVELVAWSKVKLFSTGISSA